MQCNSVKGLDAQLTGEDIALFYIYIYIYTYRWSEVVCKASMLD